MQRVLDIFFSSLALLVLAPLLIPVMVILKFTGEGEIFFTQQRVGKDGKMFGLLKFATMLKDSPNIGTGTITLQGDPRVLPFGKFLRKSKLNEVPQLINVLKGDMAIIGPRPQTKRCFLVFNEKDQKNIKKIKPGLSGIGSIIFRDEEGLMARKEIKGKEYFYDHVISPYKGRVESWYVENQSIGLYFKLIWLTARVVVFPNQEIHYDSLFKDFPTPPENLHLRKTTR